MRKKIAILGANGRIGAEICQILSRNGLVTVVPICRNRMGSAVLRNRGIACRHGQVADSRQAGRLLGDCDVVANLALASSTTDSRSARRANEAMITNACLYAPRHATQVHFSSLAVYFNTECRGPIPTRSAYGREKLRLERTFREACNAAGVGHAFLFRLGHAWGQYQGLANLVRAALRDGGAFRYMKDYASNTVHVVTIADALLKIAHDSPLPGIYDLTNVPQWTWAEVVAYEAEALGMDPPTAVPANNPSTLQQLHRALTGAMRRPAARQFALTMLPYIPSDWSYRVKAWHYVSTARAEISSLTAQRFAPTSDAVNWRPLKIRFMDGLATTRDLLATKPTPLLTSPVMAWPPDIPPAPI